MSNVVYTPTPPPDFFASFKSTLHIYDNFFGNRAGGLIAPYGGLNLADIAGNFIVTKPDGELGYTRSLLYSSSFTIIIKLAFLSKATGAPEHIIDCYPKVLLKREGSLLSVSWVEIGGAVKSLTHVAPGTEDFEIAIVRNCVSIDNTTTSLYYNGELVSSYCGSNSDQRMGLNGTDDMFKINPPAQYAIMKIYDMYIWGTPLNSFAIRNHFTGVANYLYAWNNSPAGSTWESGAPSNKPIMDAFAGDGLLSVAEGVSVSESFNHVWNSRLVFLESFGVVEKVGNMVSKEFDSSFGIQETGYSNNVNKNLLDSFSVSENMTAVTEFNRIFNEIIAVEEKVSKLYEYFTADSFSVKELFPEVVFSVGKVILEELPVAENFKRTVEYNRTFANSLQVKETVSNTVSKMAFESLKVVGDLIRNANAVVSDLEFRNDEMDLKSFLDITQSPTGYTPFRDFLSGDYIYQEALIRIVVSADVTADRPYVKDWTMNIDVPDITDRGTVEFTANNQPVHVAFSRSFHVAPEVGAVVKAVNSSDTVPTPAIFNITRDGFDMVLKAGTTYVGGKVTWTASAY